MPVTLSISAGGEAYDEVLRHNKQQVFAVPRDALFIDKAGRINRIPKIRNPSGSRPVLIPWIGSDTSG